ncbi:hypothetical protein Cni_G25594 [Canna indica]|uniref:BZIP transcription factor n=1 Tax=Canna indica TaxID=4628 RepID=A0AAQ3QL71_9LILI|nr:hypothetical protein Cni_G25594 [Canna indica]
MGCSGSKVEQQKAVALCRGRADLLAAAIRHRNALASAHAAYSDSLLSVSAALHRLLVLSDSPSSSFSPVLPLPTCRKSEPSPPPPLVSSARHSYSGSHINFLSSESDDEDEDEDDDTDDDAPLHSNGSSPVHHLDHYGTVPCGPVFSHIYYARSQPPPPSVTRTQPLQSYETVQVGSFDPYSSYSSYGDPYSHFPDNYGSMGGFFGVSSPLPAMPPPSSIAASASGRSFSFKAPPPPPSPPRTSTWDFLNPFQSYDDYYTRSIASWSSKEVRGEKGIPELEEADHEDGERNFTAFSSAAAREYSMGASARREDKMNSARKYSYMYDSRSAVAGRNSNHKQEMADKNLVINGVEKPQVEERNVTGAKKIADVSLAAGEIKAQFERASQCATELSKLLEVGKHYYHPKQSLYEVSSRMMRVMTSSSSSGFLDFDNDKVIDSSGLASTLQKLHIWERKLYHEVRAEEKMRLLLNRSHKELRHMVEKGAEASKIDSMRDLIKKLSMKIRIAIKVVDSVSKRINRLRDEELWPRITELVLGIVRMWNIMLECHQMQCQAISEAKQLDVVVSNGKLNSIHAEHIMQLEYEVLKWTSNFSAWINAQRNYVKALNGWLVLCLNCEPEVTADNAPPYSPTRNGAPPVFIVCNSWSQAMDKASEMEVLESMGSFAAAVRRLWEQQNIDQHERMIAIREMDGWLRLMEKNEKYIHKEVDSLNKKLALVPGQTGLHIYPQMFQGYTAEASCMQLGLARIFEAMKDYTASSVKAYQDLLKHCEEQKMARENARVS